jgi:hypothetical protein
MDILKNQGRMGSGRYMTIQSYLQPLLSTNEESEFDDKVGRCEYIEGEEG